MVRNMILGHHAIFVWHLLLLAINFYIKWTHVCAQSCPTLCDLMNHSPPGSSLHGIFQIRILEWVAICSSRGSSPPRDQTCVSCISRWNLYHWATVEALEERDPHTLSMGKYIGTVTIKNSLWKPKKKPLKNAKPRMWHSYTWVYIPAKP